MGKTKLNPEKFQAILLRIKAGQTVIGACDSEGIDENTFYRYLKRSKTNRDAYKKALADLELRWIRKIETEESNRWQRFAWLLERRFPDRWGKLEKFELDSRSTVIVKIVDARKLKENPPKKKDDK